MSNIFFIIGLAFSNFDSEIYKLEKELAVKSIYVYSSDNANGIYSKLLEPIVLRYFNKQSRFYFDGFSNIKAPVELNDDFFNKKSDAVMLLDIIAKENYVSIEFSLFLKNKEKYIYEFYSFPENIEAINENKFLNFIDKSLLQLPYSALILSRYDENMVLFDLGKNSNINAGLILPVYRIVDVKKHPYLNTITSVEREKVGEFKVLEIGDNISRGLIKNESKTTPILPYYKIFKDTLPDKTVLELNNEETLNQKSNSFKIFDIDRDEVLDANKAELLKNRLGSFSVSIPISKFKYVDNSSSFSTGLILKGDLFITKDWFIESMLKYQIHSFNPALNLKDAAFNSNYTDFYFYGGYKIIYNYLEILLKAGYRNFNFYTDGVQDGSIHTNKTYSAFVFGFSVFSPINPFVDAWLDIYTSLYDTLSESPFITGDLDKNTIFGFSLNGNYKLNFKYSVVYGINYDMFRSSFTNSKSTSLSNIGTYLGVNFVF